jgi:MYXO-CTERM domain-containing protein
VDELRALRAQLSRDYRRLSRERAAWIDAALGAAIAVVGILESPDPGWWLASLVLGLAVALRRRLPLITFLVAFVVISLAARWIPLSSFASVLVTGYTLAAYGRSRFVAFAVLFGAALFVTVVFGSNLSFLPDWSTAFLIIGTLWLAGSAIRTRQQQADDAEERAGRLEREQEQAHEIAIASERARIARELHDVVTHHVSVMLVQAGAARHVLPRDPGQATDALLAVEARGREALAELRGFLGVLEGGTEEILELAPQPGTRDIEALVRGVADAGLPVTLQTRGEPPPLAQGIDLATYRVVQEALTNALKYADGAPTEVVIQYQPEEVRIEVLDKGPGKGDAPDGAGRGLSGLSERLALYGGRLEAGRRPSGGFAVRASIPVAGLPAA